MPTSKVTPVTIWAIHPPHHGHPKIRSYMVTNVGLILGRCPASERLHAVLCNDVSHWLGADLKWSTHIPFVPCQLTVSFLIYGYFKIWPWKSKVKVLVKGQGHRTGPASHWFTLILVSHQSDHAFLKCSYNFQTLTLKIQGRFMGKVKDQGHITTFSFPANWTNYFYDMAYKCLTAKRYPNFGEKKGGSENNSHRISPKIHQVG